MIGILIGGVIAALLLAHTISEVWFERWQHFVFWASIGHNFLPAVEWVPRTRLGQRWPWLRDWYALFIYALEKFAALNGRGFLVQWYKSRIERNGP